MAPANAPLLDASPRAAVSVGQILTLSVPAILNNVAAPLAQAAQLAILGHSAAAEEVNRHRVAVYTAIGSATTFVANVMNFVIVVTMARVGRALGAKDWLLLGRMVSGIGLPHAIAPAQLADRCP